MAFTLQISFTGLTTLVTQADRDRRGGVTEAQFLLPDTRLGDCIAGKDIPPHPARVSFETPDGESRTWFLDQEELSIVSVRGENLSGDLSEDPSLSSMARISDATDGRAKLNDKLISNPASEGLAGSFRLGSGIISAGPRSVDVWEFRESRSARGVGRGRYAESVLVSLKIEDESALLISRGYFNDLERKTSIMPVGESAQAAIRVNNRCETPHDPQDRDSDPDFLSYYRLTPKYSGPLRFPFKVSSSDTDSRAIATSGCIPTTP